MFAQHMLAVLRTGGVMATVMPHGVLFRGGAERRDPQGADRQRPPGGDHRPAAEPVLRHRHPGLHPGHAAEGGEAEGAPGQGAVHQRRRRVPRRACAELPAARARREDRPHLPGVRAGAGVRGGRAGRGRRGQRLQLQHPPLRRQRPAARAAGRARAPRRRRARGPRSRRSGRCSPPTASRSRPSSSSGTPTTSTSPRP